MHTTTLVFLAALFAPVVSAVEQSDEKPWSLMQTMQTLTKSIAKIYSGEGNFDEIQELNLDASPANPIDHAHLVCHHHGCEEVKAQLEVIGKQMGVANAKLKDCATKRKALENNLVAASKERAKAEADLKKCGEDRQKLAKALAQCGKDRAEAEKGLAKCSAERGQLEAELKQCAEVDRPGAEKGLAACAAERGKLEKELAALVIKLKKGGSSPSKATTHRRRRRRSKRTARLVQVEASENSPDDAVLGEDDQDEAEEAEDVSLLETRQESIQQRLAELEQEAMRFEADLSGVIDRSAQASARMDAVEARAEGLVSRIQGMDQKEAEQVTQFEKAEAKSQIAVQVLAALEHNVATSTQALAASDAKLGQAEAELAAQTSLQLKAQASLIALVQKTQHLRHEELKSSQAQAGEKVGKLEAMLEDKKDILQKDHGEECDELRGKVIHAKAKLDAAADALANCLQAKVDIQAKIDKVEELRAAAKRSLDQCLATKTKLKAAVDECHSRRDSARSKLQECLDRKKDLKIKIAACHEKRDEARKKLAECLKNKKMLAEKIAKAKASLAGKSSLVEVASDHGAAEGDALQDIEEALEALRKANADFDVNAQENIEIGNLIQSVLTEIENASGEEHSVLQQLKEASLLEIQNQVTLANLQTALQDTFEDLKAIDRQADAAKAESDAVGKIADQAGAALSSLLQSLTM